MKIQEQITIDLPVESVFPYLIDVRNRSDYIPLLEEVVLLDPPPVALGTRYVEVSTIGGRKLETIYQVAVLKENQWIGVKTLKSVFPIRVDIHFTPEEGRTGIDLKVVFELSGIFRLGSRLVQGIVRQQARDILKRVKRKLEGQSV